LKFSTSSTSWSAFLGSTRAAHPYPTLLPSWLWGLYVDITFDVSFKVASIFLWWGVLLSTLRVRLGGLDGGENHEKRREKEKEGIFWKELDWVWGNKFLHCLKFTLNHCYRYLPRYAVT
jgi:hypothetical protein